MPSVSLLDLFYYASAGIFVVGLGSWLVILASHRLIKPCIISPFTSHARLASANTIITTTTTTTTSKSNHLPDSGPFKLIIPLITVQGICYIISLILAENFAASLASFSNTPLKFNLDLVNCTTILFIILPFQCFDFFPSLRLIFWLCSSVQNSWLLVHQLLSSSSPMSINVLFQPEFFTQIAIKSLLAFTAIILLSFSLRNYSSGLSNFKNSTTSYLSQLTFSWLNPLLHQASVAKYLSNQNVKSLPFQISSDQYHQSLCTRWKISHKLCRSLAATFWKPMLGAIFLQAIESSVGAVQPILLNKLIHFVRIYPTSDNHAFSCGFRISLAMFSLSFGTSFLSSQSSILLYRTSLHILGALTQLIYSKSLCLSHHAQINHSTSQISNLISIDSSRLQSLSQQIPQIISLPLKLSLAIYSLYYILGNSVIFALAILVLLLPLNTILLRRLKNLKRQQMQYRDSRTQKVHEMVSSIQCVKLYGWEQALMAKVKEIRIGKELDGMWWIGMLGALVKGLWGIGMVVVIGGSFAIVMMPESAAKDNVSNIMLSKMPLTSETIFPCLSLFSYLQKTVVSMPSFISSIIESKIALERLEEYLLSEEVSTNLSTEEVSTNESITMANNDKPFISINNTCFLWDETHMSKPKISETSDEESLVGNFDNFSYSNIALRNINMSVNSGEMVLVVGAVGAGKSTLLKAIIGELPILRNHDHSRAVKGSISYCSQIPWIQNTSFRDNILFHIPYDPERYHSTLYACDLLVDILQLPDGDQTLVGEKGITLSGGQKARLALARAIYADSDIYILDDILSAVDVQVAKRIIYRCLGHHGLLANKIRVLVSHGLGNFQKNEIDKVIYLQNGEIIANDSFENMQDKIKEFMGGGSQETVDYLTEGPIDDDNDDDDDDDDAASDLTISPISSCSVDSLNSSETLVASDKDDDDLDKLKKPIKLSEEHTNRGSVKWKTYSEYAKSCSIPGIIIFLTMIFASCAFQLGSKYWLKILSEKNDFRSSFTHSHDSTINDSSVNFSYFLIIYMMLGTISHIFDFLKTFVLYQFCCINASRHLHDSMLNSIINSPMSFFNTTPAGRILNRFTNDINKIDDNLPKTFIKFFGAIISALFTVGVIVFNLPLFFIPLIGLIIIYRYYQSYYISVSRDLKRISSASRSPIFNYLQESLSGAETVRAFRKTEKFTAINAENVNFHLKALYVFRAINRWLTFRLQIIGALVILLTSVLALLSLDAGTPLTSGVVGLMMGYALEITDSLNVMVKTSVDIETNVVCVERILDYSNLPREGESISQSSNTTKLSNHGINRKFSDAAATQWPSNGALEFRNYTTKYRPELDSVLKDLSLRIEPGEKVGIVGRTGAGKSSLAMAIFRLIEASQGQIFIDGKGIDQIQLSRLRSNLSIIPQECLAFQGTIRQNLDPIGKHTDEQLLWAVGVAHLDDHLPMRMGSMHHNVFNDNHEIIGGRENGFDADSLASSSISCFQEGTSVGCQSSRYSDYPKSSILDIEIQEAGRNFSVGQRQLLCLARALLNPSRILILDEATAAVDPSTDKIIQETIKRECQNKTILTIAHRLNTVLDCDRIIVLDQGKVVEFDKPEVLLQDTKSAFYSLCHEGCNL
ncbi:hypothetical protein DASC09_003650 [Saccharomycopsis crataegensis]|uniref:Uncharacterized protein n=1 Tax=Saccharomycopsis crataegensis TaxID=43959 RepID=A0AAV5QDM3_9ASCO|nr:hypothetical protein DASC09_003650 [Saccharomycopsis crataegensis]